MKDRQQEMMRELADRMNAVGFEPIGMAAAKEKIQEHLNDNAKPEKDAARKTAEYWKAEHLAGNAIIESLRAELAELRARVSEPVAWMHNKRVDVIHTSVKSLLSDFAVNSGPESMLRPIDKSEHYTIPLYAATVPAQPELGMPVWRELWTGSGSNGNGDSMRRGSHIYAYETHLKTHGDHVVWLGESPEAHEAAAKICREHNATMALVSHPDPSVIGHLGCHPVPAQPAAVPAEVARAVQILRKHNEWRRGADNNHWQATPYSPAELGRAIDMVCDATHDIQHDVLKRATQYAHDIVTWLHRDHYADNTKFEPFGDLLGLLSQIDNMICGWKEPQSAVPDDVAKDAERYRWIRSDMKMLWGDDVLAIIGESGASFDAAIDAAILAADTEGRKDWGAR